VKQWLAARPRVVERVEQAMHGFFASTTVGLAMLAVVSRQLRGLVES
jgi:NAD-specific glutamate dehydrogenase